jgi:cytochrome c oxidase subunit 4
MSSDTTIEGRTERPTDELIDDAPTTAPDAGADDAQYPPSQEIRVGGHGHKEPTDGQYIWIAVFLAVLTALEIAATEIGYDGPLLIPVLIGLMVVKFFVVVSFFMHLRFDSRLFSLMFYIGLTFAVVLYTAVLATFHFFTG